MLQNKKRNRLATLGLFIIVFILSVSLLAVMFLKKPVSELNLDTRKAAMVDSGLAELDTYPFNQSTLKVNEEQKINLQVNTKGKSVDTIELIFEVIADEGLLDKSKIKFTGSVPSELEISKQEVIESICDKDCYTVTLLLNIKNSATTFNTHDQMATISQLAFTPKKEGSLKIKISQDSTVIENQTTADILQKPSVLDFQYYVTQNGIDRSQCHFEYTSWGECKNGWQTRQYSVQPDRCQWYDDETLKELSQKCTSSDTVSANSKYFYLYSNDTCLNQPSNGSSLYIIWDKEKYSNVTWIDVSNSPTFSDYYHKKVDGNIDQTNGNWIMVNAKDFTNSSSNKGPLSIEPSREYFFRLYTTNDGGKHISSARYYINYCSGNQSSYKNCNEACGEGTDQSKSCAPGLSCINNMCRNASNPDNSLCLTTPGIQTTDRSCNQYCSNSNECGAGLSCFWNRCRSANNLESSTCESKTVAKTSTYRSSSSSKGGTNINSYTDSSTGKTVLLPSEAYDLTTNGCNQGCNNNRDCDADMRCYKGKCRLADNPEEIACKIASTSDTKSSTSSSAAAKIVTATPTETEAKAQINQTFFTKLLSSFSWQWLAFAGFILLVAIALIVVSIANTKKDPWTMSAHNSGSPTSIKKEEPQNTVKIPEDKPLKL